MEPKPTIDPESSLADALSTLPGDDFRRLALQTRSRAFRDYLARAITHGARDFDQLLEAVLDEVPFALLHPRSAALLARIVATQRLAESDPEYALAIFDRVLAHYGGSALDNDEKLIYVDLLEGAGRAGEVVTEVRELGIARRTPVEAAALYANVELSRHGAGSEQWLDALNDLFATDDLAPLALSPGTAPVLDRLESTSAAASVRGPLVTVIVPTWNPGPWLWTAVRSLTQQTYADLEILVMDDHSAPEFSPQLERLLSMDPRISIITSDANRGTYAGRNAAVRDHAHGDYVTVQDDDDWSHPERIERQVAFSRSGGLELGVCRAARVTEDMRFVRRGPTFARPGYPTTLVTRATFAEIGYWDPVRRNSDSEFIRRVKRARRPMAYLGQAPMMLQRHRAGSLSSAEVWEGYTDQPRRWQEWLSAEWYDRSEALGRRIYMGSGVALQRPYPAPRGLTRTALTESANVDVLIVSDLGIDHPDEDLVHTLAEEHLSLGKTIGLLHIDGVRPLSNAVSPALAALTRAPGVTILSWSDEAVVGVAHIVEPRGIALCDSVESRVHAERVVVHGAVIGESDILTRLLHLADEAEC